MKSKNFSQSVVVYQTRKGALELKGDPLGDTIWVSLNQIADVFGRDKSVISRHVKNIYKSGELDRDSTVAKIATVQTEGERKVSREVEYYNLDVVLSVGYRVDSKQATKFRIWATDTLKRHLIDGFTLNKKRLQKNYDKFLAAVQDVKALLPESQEMEARDVLELVTAFAHTWFSLDAYDKEKFPSEGTTKKDIFFAAEELNEALGQLKHDLISKNQASDVFGRETKKDSICGIVGNIFQSFGGTDVYPTVEEKAAHLLYFIVKNHPFVDGNKRSGAFAFIWFLTKARILPLVLTSEALTAITLLVAESNPKDKGRMIGLIMLLLKG